MKNNYSKSVLLGLLVLLGGLLSACGANGGSSSGSPSGSPSVEPSAGRASAESSASAAQPEDSGASAEAGGMREYTDFSGRKSIIPEHPRKVVLLGNNPGDLLALGVKPIGNDWLGEPYMYKNRLEGVEDVGYPHNIEKIMSLQPDLILQNGYGDAEDDETYAAMSKIAPTAVFDRGASTYERIRAIADILGVKQAAEDWIVQYESKAKAMWQRIGLKEGDTAAVYLSLAGDFYVMGDFSLTRSLYQPGGFSPPPKVQELIDQGELFTMISEEVIDEYAGDYVLLLSQPGTEDEQAARKLTESAMWQSIPAFKNGKAYLFDIGWNAGDPITMELLLEELPKLLGK